MNNRVVVSRHKAAVEFVARQLGGKVSHDGTAITFHHRVASGHTCEAATGEPSFSGCAACEQSHALDEMAIPVITSAAAADVTGRVVYGNLPLHLAALASAVVAIEFAGTPPRGQEYTLTDMVAAGARMVAYRVEAHSPPRN